MKRLLEGLPPYMRRNAEVHLWWLITALFIAAIVSGCGQEVKAGQPVAAPLHTSGQYSVEVFKVQKANGTWATCVGLFGAYGKAVSCEWSDGTGRP